MTELIAYRYKTRHRLRWCKWRSGRTRDVMMAELRAIGGASTITIVQCVVPKSASDETTGATNDLWEWTQNQPHWYRVDRRNWFADTCDPTYNYDNDNPNEPFEHPMTEKQLSYWRKQLRGVDDITAGITAVEMAEEADA